MFCCMSNRCLSSKTQIDRLGCLPLILKRRVQIAPAVRAVVGGFGLPVGQSTLGQITTALKQMA